MEPQILAAAVANINAGLRRYIATRPIATQDMFLARFLPPVRGTQADIKAGGNFRITTAPAARHSPSIDDDNDGTHSFV